ncbi:MAG: DsbA family protein [Mobiluncus sp.]|nr:MULTISPECIES: thioredoxin domain-containing protein [Mobiluncus]MCI6585153.1 DsbA family protein [Mobiluncus sp.]
MAKQKPLGNGAEATDRESVKGSGSASSSEIVVERSAANVATLRALAVLIVLVLIVIAFFLGRASVNPDTNAGGAANPNASASGATNGAANNPEKQLVADFVAQTGLVPGQDFSASLSEENGKSTLAKVAAMVDTPERTLGKSNAPVSITVMSDFSCPMCTQWETKTLPGLQKYIDDGTVKLQWFNLVIFAEQYGSDFAAHGSIAAANQGKLWDFVHAAYNSAGEGNHANYDAAAVLEVAKTAGIPDLAKFEADMNSEAAKAQVDKESNMARSVGVNGTPFFIIGDSVISGALPLEYFERTIQFQKFAAEKA